MNIDFGVIFRRYVTNWFWFLVLAGQCMLTVRPLLFYCVRIKGWIYLTKEFGNIKHVQWNFSLTEIS
jgi:hypothetical protein